MSHRVLVVVSPTLSMEFRVDEGCDEIDGERNADTVCVLRCTSSS